jgi:hypothetical protein
MDEKVIDLSRGVLLDKKPAPSAQEKADDELTAQILGQMLGEAKINLIRAQEEDDFLDYLEQNGVAFESEHYIKLFTEERKATADTVIYYDQRVEFLSQKFAEADKKVRQNG